ncbi:DUF2975 domain-containing protein [Spirosoma rhododendri]|uniref:DUF2975 domain-containing protein n=1 Tax=Spirosoma rhododendri TaxID=2728024 RepID=A0A7L5DUK5_9BACT|nr:DUF2975 domain-containing protein [Spirosoma rhododendri]QJD79647.1 DUF2975 domain-containing protein [Spirosoma rhododendri]
MKTKTKQIIPVAHVVAWIIYIGLCIKAGGLIISFIISLMGNPALAGEIYADLDLSMLRQAGMRHYISVVSLLAALYCLKAHVFYILIQILSTLNLDYPFSTRVASWVDTISQLMLGMSVLALIAEGYCGWLAKRGVAITQSWGSSEYLFMAGVVFIVALVFRRGTEMQAENELTV